ncbi:hypothetical protein POM88_039497 [Heracleum sosnowskyi]|uniref:RNase H type-1 domain-containing protein n=1 Tax=Heracleum sosnowskyi TaxID=360622 RepID=A0AAD8HBH7_9APIA|nr:hypothetical protein POM88_039497 [Heracleum sosnowskyi]
MACKLNVKGVYDEATRSASVWGIMKRNGRWVRGLGGCIGLADPVTAELWAIYYGLKMAWERNKANLVVFSECRETITIIRNDDPEYPMVMFVDMIRMLLGENWTSVDIQPTHADANGGANVMADYYLIREGGSVRWMSQQKPSATSSKDSRKPSAKSMFLCF